MSPQFNKRSWSDFPLRDLVDEVAQSLAPRCKDQAIETVLDVPSNLIVTADRRLIRRAVENLMLGAHRGDAQAAARSGPLPPPDPTPWNSRSPTPGRPCPTKPDATPSIPPATPERGASGWELAMVHHIAKIHGGSVTAANCPEGGVAFTLRIPRRAALEAAA